MMFLQFLVLWLLASLALAVVWALIAMGAKRLHRWAEAELRRQNQLDAAWCPGCFRLGGNHADDCEWVIIAGRSREGRL